MLVDEAYDELGIGPTQLANLRRQALQGALDALVPRPGGRPRKEPEVTVAELEALRLRNQQLEREIAEMRARVELAILPFLGKGKRKGRGPSGGGE
jgi:transposase-like protein